MVEPIAVIGLGCRFPGNADTPSKLWSVLKDPQDLRSKPPASRFDIDAFYHPVGTHHGTTDTKTSYFLHEDAERCHVKHFDAGFFNIQPAEAEAMDPQQRLLMETVYDTLCTAGQPLEKLRGSDTAVYVGMMCDDYNTTLTRDWETLPRYTATGLERAIVANRVSYFFDWHGPSMSIDTACSSSLVAVDQAVQALRNGTSQVALAAGTSLILSPAMYISESNLGMLSPQGRSAMWDASADGYARGEGVAAVLLKTLSQALADHDPIHCLIRDTAVNQDGRTPGLTVPSSAAQAKLIRQCYANIGLDPVGRPADRPQFFQAHGTGTQAGDPQEAEAIARALFPEGGSVGSHIAEPLLVGSIKTIIGHTEGTAGVASLIAVCEAIRHSIIPPNLHFSSLNPKVAPFCQHLKIPTEATPWPVLHKGAVKRASVNSFGFGGTNAHCILEEYIPSRQQPSPSGDVLYAPLTFSAASEMALRKMLAQHMDYLNGMPQSDWMAFAHTLQHGRSTLPYRVAITASTQAMAVDALGTSPPFKTRFGASPARIVGIFTGQGAQWPRMAAELIESSAWVAERLERLDDALQTLPNVHERPDWCLRDELLAPPEMSRLSEAAVSQPLCTAVQLVLVDVLLAAEVQFSAVLGHSSGEIAAAYAAGLVTSRDAIRIAYLRGLHAQRAKSPNSNGESVVRGAMMAVGMSREEAESFCQQTLLVGRLQMAAENAASSVTLSGDEDAIDEALAILTERGTFCRKLRVDTAYHSRHMEACAEPYLSSLNSYELEASCPPRSSTITWYSSVWAGQAMTRELLFENKYWVDNMCRPVLLASALGRALAEKGPADVVVEVGPHPALQGPVMAAMEAVGSSKSKNATPYTGLLSRSQSDVESLGTGLGVLWANLGPGGISLSAVQTLLGCQTTPPVVLTDLPAYPFDHQRVYWTDSRVANHYKHRQETPNSLLGVLSLEASTPGERQWRNILKPSELPWLHGHRLQGQTVLPATGYACMALEMVKALTTGVEVSMGVVQIADMQILRAMAFDDDNAAFEIICTASSISVSDMGLLSAQWSCYSAAVGGEMTLHAQGSVTCRTGAAAAKPATSLLSICTHDAYDLVSVENGRFYDSLSRIGYDYAAPFRGLSHIRRRPDYSTAQLVDQSGPHWEDQMVVHPGLLDSALQSVFAAWSFPGDTHIWSLHVPVSIDRITIDPTALKGPMTVETRIHERAPAKVVSDISIRQGSSTVAVLDGVTLVPFSPGSPRDDLPMFAHMCYDVAVPDGLRAAAGETIAAADVQMYHDIDRVAFWYLRTVAEAIPESERGELLPHFQHYLRWCDRMVRLVRGGGHGKVGAACIADTRETVAALLAPYAGRKDIRFLEVVGAHLEPVLRAGSSMLDHMNQDGLLRAFYEENGICSGPTSRWLARLVAQIAHRCPGLRIFEVGAGTGATTSAVLEALAKQSAGSLASYTFTDISSGFLLPAEARFGVSNHHMRFATFNMERAPADQGFVEGGYDVVLAVNVVHVAASIEMALTNMRRLLRPGGFLILAELTSTELLFSGMSVGTLPGWWVGAESGRPWGPLLTADEWDSAMRKTGFSGVDTASPDISHALPMRVLLSQAVDDRVALLRDPLSSSHPEGIATENLVLIGGTTASVARLVADTVACMGSRFHRTHVFDCVTSFVSFASGSPSLLLGTAILCLTDLDTPYLADLTPAKFAALQVLLGSAGTLIWATRGARLKCPYSYMMLGIAHTVRSEYPSLHMQIYDLPEEDVATANSIAAAVLRQHALRAWKDVYVNPQHPASPSSSLLWTIEPEMYVDPDGVALVARLLPDQPKNMRYNARRRAVWDIVAPATEPLELVGHQLRKPSPLEIIGRTDNNGRRLTRTIHPAYSLLQGLVVGGFGVLRLLAGTDVDMHEPVVALTDSNLSPAHIPAEWCLPVRSLPSAHVLRAMSAHMIADRILSLVDRDSIIVLHDADTALQSSLSAKAGETSVTIVFTTSTAKGNGSDIFLHADLPRHVLQSRLPLSISVFVYLGDTALPNAIRQLFGSCLVVDRRALFGDTLHAFQATASSSRGLTYVLRKALGEVLQQEGSPLTLSPSSSAPSPIFLDDINDHSGLFAVVDWMAKPSLLVQVQPIDSGPLFSAKNTYLFAGMAGELGRTLASWMITRGARHIVLASRRPPDNTHFIAYMHSKYGATVEVLPLDVTSRASICALQTRIGVTMPPVAGVVNGAMVLDDELLANMTFDQFSRVCNPKIYGTQLLDELFGAGLDFFIALSSIASVIGWSGQSNYSAANECMTALVRQRRLRGCAASVMNIPAVAGVGYAAHAAAFDFSYFQSLGYINISEADLCSLFAEAILSGHPGDGGEDSQVIMGINAIPADLHVPEVHRRDVRFSHLVLHQDISADDDSTSRVAHAAVHVEAQLASAKTQDDAVSIVSASFAAYLKRVLRLGPNDHMEPDVALVDQGVDSLVAVDIRAWFLKELHVDIPTLKVLGGGSIALLSQTAVEKCALRVNDDSPAGSTDGKSVPSIDLTPRSAGSPTTRATSPNLNDTPKVER